MTRYVYPENDHEIVARGVRSGGKTGPFLNNASITCVLPGAGNVAMVYVAESDGVYRAALRLEQVDAIVTALALTGDWTRRKFYSELIVDAGTGNRATILHEVTLIRERKLP
jgi:hypothetical protein